MDVLKSLESALDDIFVKKAPALPVNAKKFIVQYLPWINLILGLFTLVAARALWSWAHTVNSLVNYANNLSSVYGGTAVAHVNHLGFSVWLALVVLAIEALLYIAAFPGTRDRQKSGWNLLFYALLINIVYGVINLFTNYGGSGTLISAVVGSAIGFYFLFQIRGSYLKSSARVKRTPEKT